MLLKLMRGVRCAVCFNDGGQANPFDQQAQIVPCTHVQGTTQAPPHAETYAYTHPHPHPYAHPYPYPDATAFNTWAHVHCVAPQSQQSQQPQSYPSPQYNELYAHQPRQLRQSHSRIDTRQLHYPCPPEERQLQYPHHSVRTHQLPDTLTLDCEEANRVRRTLNTLDHAHQLHPSQQRPDARQLQYPYPPDERQLQHLHHSVRTHQLPDTLTLDCEEAHRVRRTLNTQDHPHQLHPSQQRPYARQLQYSYPPDEPLESTLGEP